jgi:hypothetical protein
VSVLCSLTRLASLSPKHTVSGCFHHTVTGCFRFERAKAQAVQSCFGNFFWSHSLHSHTQHTRHTHTCGNICSLNSCFQKMHRGVWLSVRLFLFVASCCWVISNGVRAHMCVSSP